MKPAAKIYLRDFGLSMVLYTAAIVAVNMYLEHATLPQWQMAGMALIPVLPIILSVKAVLAFSRTWDELEKQQAMEGTLIAFFIVGMGTFTYGFLEGVGFPPLETVWIFPMLIFSQGLGRMIVRWKYQ
jgi:hypothetical protein